MEGNTINSDVTMGGAEATLLVNRYRVVHQLGQGGMGSVWLAEDTQLDNRQVAIKMLPSVLVSNKRAYQQLKSEALVSLKLTHPNIATVRAFEENDGNPFLVVDYIDGVTLDDYLLEKCDAGRAASMRPPHVDAIVSIASDRKDPSSFDAFETNASTSVAPYPGGLSESEVIRLLTPIAAALDYAHSKGVVHRDVKPGNVMISKDGTPYILDFGIAREIQETMTRVTGKLSSGTLMYMSPEQLNGDAPSAAQDIYSFAAMAYECLTGTPPFSRGNIEYQIMNKEPAPIDPHFMKCGQGVIAGLSKNSEDRPASCSSVLQRCKCSSVAEVMPSGIDCPRCSRKLQVTIFCILLLTALAGVGIAWDRLTYNERHRAAALAAFAKKDWKSALDDAFETDLNDSDLVCRIAECYARGLGVAKDEMEAVKWFRKAAEKNNADAQSELGVMYMAGKGVPKDDAEAAKWERKAAEQGHAPAQFLVGQMYEFGKGVAMDLEEAVKWYRKAAAQERYFIPAQFRLGYMYAHGRGVSKDEAQAEKWIRKAAENGDADAQNFFGWMCESGYGVAKDDSEAIKWYRKAADQGNTSAKDALKRFGGPE